MSVNKYSNIIFCNTHNLLTQVLLSRKGTPENPKGKFNLIHCANINTISDTSLVNIKKIIPVEDTLYVVRYVDYDFSIVPPEDEYFQWVTIEDDINSGVINKKIVNAINIICQL